MKKLILKNLIFLLGIALIQSVIFVLVLFFLERLGIFAIEVSYFNELLIYPLETGGFLFALILISDFVVEIIRYFIKRGK